MSSQLFCCLSPSSSTQPAAAPVASTSAMPARSVRNLIAHLGPLVQEHAIDGNRAQHVAPDRPDTAVRIEPHGVKGVEQLVAGLKQVPCPVALFHDRALITDRKAVIGAVHPHAEQH